MNYTLAFLLQTASPEVNKRSSVVQSYDLSNERAMNTHTTIDTNRTLN